MDHLGRYLNDHLAGSVGALELLDRLIETYEGKALAGFFSDLRREIEADQTELRDLIDNLDEKESAVRKAGAWVAEKLSRGKIRLDESSDGEMGLFLALEALGLGIAGKGALWRGLAAASEMRADLRRLDFARLEQRAVEQHDRVEAERLKVASTLFRSEK